jgi:hypothetical protein
MWPGTNISAHITQIIVEESKVSETIFELWSLSIQPMDQITIKTPNPRCRLYWCLIELKEWRYTVSHVGIFDPLVNYRSSYVFTGSGTGVCIHTVRNEGGGVELCGDHIGVIYCVIDQIPNREEGALVI